MAFDPIERAGVPPTKPFWVPHSSRLYRDGWGGCSLAPGPCPVRFDFDAARLAGRPVARAAPGPVLGLFDETASNWIAVDVIDLLDEFILREYVEVVVSGLPELGPVAFE